MFAALWLSAVCRAAAPEGPMAMAQVYQTFHQHQQQQNQQQQQQVQAAAASSLQSSMLLSEPGQKVRLSVAAC